MRLLTSLHPSHWFLLSLTLSHSIISPAQAEERAPAAAEASIEDAAKPSPFPLSASFGVSNSVGIGTFMPGYQRMPSWGTGISLGLGLNLPELGILPKSRINVGSSISVPWLYAYNGGSNANLNQPLIGDTRINYGIGSLYKSEALGLNFGISGGVSLPTSMRSRYNNLATSLRTAAPLSFTLDTFSVSWTPSFGYNIYSQASPLTQRMYSQDDPSVFLVVCRPEEVLGDDTCLRKGRPTDFSLSNALSLGYGFMKHQFGVGLTWGFGFQRAISDAPELKSENASDQDFGESVVGSLSYGYDFEGALVPDLGLSLTTGGSPYTPTGDMRFWFFDYLTPSNNLTQIGLNLKWRL